MEIPEKSICMIRGTESILFVLPIEVATELAFTNDNLLKFEVKNGILTIQKDGPKFNDSLKGIIQT